MSIGAVFCGAGACPCIEQVGDAVWCPGEDTHDIGGQNDPLVWSESYRMKLGILTLNNILYGLYLLLMVGFV